MDSGASKSESRTKHFWKWVLYLDPCFINRDLQPSDCVTLARVWAIWKVPTVSMLDAMMGTPENVSFEFRKTISRLRSTWSIEEYWGDLIWSYWVLLKHRRKLSGSNLPGFLIGCSRNSSYRQIPMRFHYLLPCFALLYGIAQNSRGIMQNCAEEWKVTCCYENNWYTLPHLSYGVHEGESGGRSKK